jgi:hypothetical protein
MRTDTVFPLCMHFMHGKHKLQSFLQRVNVSLQLQTTIHTGLALPVEEITHECPSYRLHSPSEFIFVYGLSATCVVSAGCSVTMNVHFALSVASAVVHSFRLSVSAHARFYSPRASCCPNETHCCTGNTRPTRGIRSSNVAHSANPRWTDLILYGVMGIRERDRGKSKQTSKTL